MIIISGALRVNTSQTGENTIKTGRLICPLGEFIVKHTDLNLLQDGHYEGIFELARIQQGFAECEGKLYVEIEAVVNHMAFKLDSKPQSMACDKQSITEVSETNTQNDLAIQDSITNASQTTLAIVPSKDTELFGSLWPLGEAVQLDAAQNRDLIAMQSKRLNALGYVHDMRTQTWHKQKTAQ